MGATEEINPLIIAYACEPALGSEPGVGWNLVQALARIRPVFVITHEQHRAGVEAYLAKNGDGRMRFAFYTLPRLFDFALVWPPLLNLYYYFWHIGAARLARKLNQQHRFAIAHHVTYVRYWMPTAAAKIGLPFVWGPVGGGESAPASFNRDLGLRGRCVEIARSIIRWIFEWDPRLKSAAKACDLGIAASEQSAQRMRKIGFRNVRVMSAVGHVQADAEHHRATATEDNVLRFVSIGRLLHWKGFHLGLRAFARADIPNSEYVVVGNGPDRPRLEKLAKSLGISDRVRFTGALPRREGLAEMQRADVLVHPSLHDSGGFVVLEAMDLKMPVICLDLGGPAVCVDETNGFKIAAHSTEQAINDIANAMTNLTNSDLRRQLGETGRWRATEEFSWFAKAQQIDAEYRRILAQQHRAFPTTNESLRNANSCVA